MATAPEITLGDSRPYTVNLTINGAAFPIPSTTSTVQAAIVASDKKTALTSAPLSLSNSTPGADWDNSKVVVKFPRAATATITTVGKAFLEIQVTFNAAAADADDWTWFIPITLVAGTIV
jgi:PKD repeat protein